MIRTIEAAIDENGSVRLPESVRLPAPCRDLVTILDEEPPGVADEPALLSEASLAGDWDRPEEDEAWAYLRPAR